jgi:hypothetical protein
MMWRIVLVSLASVGVTTACVGPTKKVNTPKNVVEPQKKPTEPSPESLPATKNLTRWNLPEAGKEFVYLGMGTFDTWADKCQKFSPKMLPLILDVNFSKAIARQLLSGPQGSVFNSEEVRGSVIIDGRMIAYMLPALKDKACEFYPVGEGGGRLPAFFVPMTAMQRGQLREQDLLGRAYTCKLAGRVNFPVPIVCGSERSTHPQSK